MESIMENRSKRGRPRVIPSRPLTWREDTLFLIVSIEIAGGDDLFADNAEDLARYKALKAYYLEELA
jgi:hypothetical protein